MFKDPLVPKWTIGGKPSSALTLPKAHTLFGTLEVGKIGYDVSLDVIVHREREAFKDPCNKQVIPQQVDYDVVMTIEAYFGNVKVREVYIHSASSVAGPDRVSIVQEIKSKDLKAQPPTKKGLGK